VTFGAPAVRALGGPAWLARRRLEAFEAFEAAPLPSGDEEIWRYSRVADLHLERFAPAGKPGDADAVPPLPPMAEALVSRVGTPSALVVTWNGSLVSSSGGAPGLEIGGVETHPGAEMLVGSVSGWFASSEALRARNETPPADSFDLLATAYAPDACVITLAPGAVVEAPIVVVHVIGPSSFATGPKGADDDVSGPAIFPRTVVHLAEDAEATVIELLVSTNGPMLVVPTVELALGDSARLRHCVVQELGRASWQVGHVSATAGRDATFRSFQASLGGTYARSRIDSVLTGQGGTAQLLAAYLGDGDQMHDFRTLQEHAAPRTTSDLVFKGAVGGSSRSVYSGLIRMRHGARGANAFQTNRNLVLSDGAHADSVPNLDIEENDVKCSHASAVGPIDAEQRFYLESRGVPRAAAERLILVGFFEELLERVPVPVARHVVSQIEGRVAAITRVTP
jgi:Fe-S cluster assembly protein SufD